MGELALELCKRTRERAIELYSNRFDEPKFEKAGAGND
jgi:hypothetical protein